MIVQIRIDDRLIHGQVALVWSKELNTPGILVANDNAATNQTVKMTLKMACPTGIKLIVKTVEDAKSIITDPRGKDMRIFALTRNVKDALELVKSCGDEIMEVNMANVGRHDAISDNEKIMIDNSNRVALTKDELEAAKELAEIMGNRFVHQIVPTYKKQIVAEMIKSLKV